jgi:hypothetical protein
MISPRRSHARPTRESKPAQAFLAVGPQTLAAPIREAAAAKPALGRDHQPLGIGMQRLCDELLGAAVGVRGVDQVDSGSETLAEL